MHGWLRLGDDAPAGGEITGISGKEISNYNESNGGMKLELL